MIHPWKNVWVPFFVLLLSFASPLAKAQILSLPGGMDQNGLLATSSTAGSASAAAQQAIDQMNAVIKVSTQATIDSYKRASYDGNGTITIPTADGQVYTFDVLSGAKKTTEALTTLGTNPVTPRAQQDVEIRVSNYSTNLMEDRIIWMVNKKVVQDQVGGSLLKIHMGNIGDSQSVVVTVFSRSLGEFFSKDLTLTPGDVAVLWEANTYIPPFYKGKPLPSYRSTIKLVPLPSIVAFGKRVDPENLLYAWKRGYSNKPEMSGYGKRFATIEAGIGEQEEQLTLNVTDPDSGATAERSVKFSIVPTKLLFYAGSPLLGTRYDHALERNFSLVDQEAMITGVPYFFSNEELQSGLSQISWKQNGVQIPSTYGSILLRKPGGQAGSSRIEASVSNDERILQNATNQLSVNYAN